MAIKRLANESCAQNPESSPQITSLLGKFKQNTGIEDENGLNEVTLPKYLQKCPLMIPNDFLCPISLEIMMDPVIVATGQSYERSSIQKWLDAGHRTCPKTRQTLSHWCEKNMVELMKKDALPSPELKDHNDKIKALVHNLSSLHLDVERKAVKRIRKLSKENPENCVLIAKFGGIPSLIHFFPTLI
ncbi:hypothetical protein HPP92_004563 [Vanilla planifolia]|uniref:U-box domain-containing protein n=1 Tax=Vanilla planifolia TaxID=51239 RepID=A0A835VAI0_VANPL|nr:hypothetical protein HPP92_004563 [Vanilla planifolia]